MKAMLAGLFVAAALLSGGASQGGSEEGAANPGRDAFVRLQSLVGDWEAPLPNNEVMRNVFRPIAFGTALAHEEWKNGEQLTATVFYVVGPDLHAAHFCDMGNQLHYVAAPSADMSAIHFALRDATNLDTHPMHFRSTTWRMSDADRLIQDWEAVTPGKAPRTVRLEFKRTGPARAINDPEAVVRADVYAMNQGDSAARLALFSPDARVFQPSQHPDRLAGELSDTMGTHEQRAKSLAPMLARRPLPHVELLDIASAGDLVAAKLRLSDHAEGARPSYALTVYRIRDGLIQDVWQLASTDADAATARREAEEVVRRLAEVNNRGDLEGFLALFSPQAKNFRSSGTPHTLGDKPSISIVDEKTRRDAYTKMFANGAPAQVQTLGTVALGGMIIASEIATLPDGKVIDEMSVYRIENGLIMRDWFIFYQTR